MKANTFGWALIGLMVLLAMPAFSAGQQESEAAASDGLIELTYMSRAFNVENPLTENLIQAIRDEFNVDFVVDKVNRDTYGEKVNIVFASGAYPEWLDLTDYRVVSEAAQNDVLIDVQDIVDTHPVWSNVDGAVFKATTVDGRVYGLPRFRPSPNVMVYRTDWAENVGVNDLRGREGFYNLMEAFALEDPDGNGENDTYAITSRYAFVTDDPITVEPFWRYFLPTGPNMLYEDKDGEIKAAWMHEEELIEALTYLNRAYEEELIDPEFVVDKKKTHENKWIDGQTGIWQKQNAFVQGRYNRLRTNFPDVGIDIIPSVENEFGFQTYGAVVETTAVYMTDEVGGNVERIKELYAWYNSTEAVQYTAGGIEGVDYEVSDGTITWLNPEAEQFYNPSLLLQSFPGMDPIVPDPYLDAMFKDVEYDQLINVDVFASQVDAWQSIQGDVLKTVQENVIEAILGSKSPEDAVAEINAMNDRLDIDGVLEQINNVRR